MEATNHRPLAVVTGASGGSGSELARQFAEHGCDLITAAEDDAIKTAASPAAWLVRRQGSTLLLPRFTADASAATRCRARGGPRLRPLQSGSGRRLL
jgi:NAD(P)-dependent dehydrogenase (short-subunit alcohol dehydrogenase family)